MKYFNTIKAWRDFRGLTQQALADACDTAKNYISYLERGERPYNQELLTKLSAALGCAPEDLVAFAPGQTQTPVIPVIGRAAASTTHGYYINEYPDGGHPVLPPWPSDSVAVDVDGDSMEPRFYHGERLIFGRQTPDPTPYVGREVLAYLGESDGRTLIKILERNKLSGGWNLRSYNPRHETLEDVHLEWIRPFEGMRAN